MLLVPENIRLESYNKYLEVSSFDLPSSKLQEAEGYLGRNIFLARYPTVMESSQKNASPKGQYPQLIPPLIKSITKHDVAGFDDLDGDTSVIEIGFAPVEDPANPSNPNRMHIHPLSTSMPPSPLRSHAPNIKRVVFEDEEAILGNEISFLALPDGAGKCMFYSQPMPRRSCSALNEHTSRFDKLRDKRFDSFKTWSGKLERQISNFRGRRVVAEQDPEAQEMPEIETFPVDRFFDALEGPELDELRASEEILLPADQRWPFLLRFPISSFGICLGVSSQAIMWKTIATLNTTKFLHITPDINLVLWAISAALTLTIAVTYTLKIIFYFEAVRREYYHPIRVNFFFAPWITLLLLALGVPPVVARDLQPPIWYALMSPILVLEIKIYGQWMSGGQRRLSKVANPSNHLSVVGNFVGALLGASMGLREGPIFFFAVGLAHYTVLFVTLYQRLPTNETLPKELHPVFFLFVAAPSVASMAWARIQGRFDYGARIAYFIALFLYFSLVVRVNFFRGFKFSLAWWAYTFPMTGAAIATVRYSDVVCNPLTRTLTVILCTISTLTVSALLVITIIHAFLLRDLFPNDIVIAISERKPVNTTGLFHMRNASSEAHIDQFLKYSASNGSCNNTEVPAGAVGMDMQQTLTEGRINV